jgi:hypothetical protein
LSVVLIRLDCAPKSAHYAYLYVFPRIYTEFSHE